MSIPTTKKSFMQAARDNVLAASLLVGAASFPAVADGEAPEPSSASAASKAQKICVAVNDPSYPVGGSCATRGYETPMSLDEIRADRDLTRDRMILHFGPGTYETSLEAEALNRMGVPSVAIPGGPDGHVMLIVDGHPITKRLFSDDEVGNGRMSITAKGLYKHIMQIKASRLEQASADAAASAEPGR